MVKGYVQWTMIRKINTCDTAEIWGNDDEEKSCCVLDYYNGVLIDCVDCFNGILIDYVGYFNGIGIYFVGYFNGIEINFYGCVWILSYGMTFLSKLGLNELRWQLQCTNYVSLTYINFIIHANYSLIRKMKAEIVVQQWWSRWRWWLKWERVVNWTRKSEGIQ